MDHRNFACRITTDVQIKGNEVVIMENEYLRLTILVDRGTDIIELLYKPKDIDFMWRSPVNLHKKADFISSTGNSFGNYLDHNSGGWQEILPNGGGECFYKGACLGMHGEISNVPWKYTVVKDTKEEIVVEFSITTLRSPFELTKKLTLKTKETKIYIDEMLKNLAHEEMHLMWGHHPTIGEPFLDEYCEISINAKTAFTGEGEDFSTQRLKANSEFTWPIGRGHEGEEVDMSFMPKKQNETADALYFKDFPKEASYKIHNKKKGLSFGIEWDGEQFPYCWLWQVANGAEGYPWYGRTYNLAIEPWTSYPSAGLTKAIENGSSLVMQSEEEIRTSLQVVIKEE